MRLTLGNELCERLERGRGGGEGLAEDHPAGRECARLLLGRDDVTFFVDSLEDAPVQLDVEVAVRPLANLDDGACLGHATEDDPPPCRRLLGLGAVLMKMSAPRDPQLFVGGPLVEKLVEPQLELVQTRLHLTAHTALGPRAPVLIAQVAVLSHDRLELVA